MFVEAAHFTFDDIDIGPLIRPFIIPNSGHFGVAWVCLVTFTWLTQITLAHFATAAS